MLSPVFIVAAKRTPFGSFGGSLKYLTATELGVHSTKAALSEIDPSLVNSVFFGNVIQSSADAAYLSRHVQLKSDIPLETPALTINRLCGSGFETVILGAQSIQLGESQIAVCGGAESMSGAPLAVDGAAARFGVPLGKGLQLQDRLWSGLTDSHISMPMGQTAENLARKYGISREDCDNYAVQSQQRWKHAKDSGNFDAEIVSVEVKAKKGMQSIDTDEHPRPETTVDKIAKLKPVFGKEGVVTAANASGICDGAGTIVLASEDAVREHNFTPLAKLISYHVSGCDPTIMGIGPVPAIQQALVKANLNLHTDIDRVEINEAFAAQFLACAKELELDMEKTNINGGAISLGHPLGASGSRITAHLANELQRRQKEIKYSVGAACIGGGQGIALVLESM